MGDFKMDTETYFKQHNIKADVKKGDVLGPKQVKATDVLFGNNDKLVNRMSDIFPKTEEN